MDIVFIEELTVITTIGVYEWEQGIRQKLVFDIEMGWNNRPAAASDDVTDCLSYADVSDARSSTWSRTVLRWWSEWQRKYPKFCFSASIPPGSVLRSANRAL